MLAICREVEKPGVAATRNWAVSLRAASFGVLPPSRKRTRYISMHTIRYQVVGEEDYAFEVNISRTGVYEVNSGTYTTQPPRKGTLSKAQEDDLLAAIKALGIPNEHPVPQGAAAFEAHLSIGEGDEAVTYSFWEGALEDDPKLNNLVRLLEKI
jgi:hypothetical protein